MHDLFLRVARSEVFISYVLILAGILVLARFWAWVHDAWRSGLQAHLTDCAECGSRISKQALLCPSCGIVKNPDSLLQFLPKE